MKAFNICALVICLISTSFSPLLYAGGASGSFGGGASGSFDSFLTKEVLTTDIQFENEAKVRLTISGGYNEHGVGQVKIESAALPKFSKHSNPILGYGRDLDNNGRIDTWFLVTKNGIELVKKEGKADYGTDILHEVLKGTYKTSVAMNVASATTSILGHLFLSVGQSLEFTEKYYKDWMDLEELRLNLFEGIEKETLTAAEIHFMYDLIDYGYADLKKNYDQFGEKTLWGYALADVALWVTGGVLFNFGAKCLAKIGVIASEKAFVQSMKESVTGFVQRQNAKISVKLAAIKAKLPKLPSRTKVATNKDVKAPVIGSAILNAATYKVALSSSLVSYRTKKKLSLYIAKTFKWPKKIYQGALSEWKYIALNSGVQLGSEAYARYDEIKSSNPFEMGQNLLTNPEVLQNVSFMAADTIMMTGISKNLTTTKARFAASGAIALTNTSVMNFVIKDDPNLTRVGFDIAWESIIGNAQVQLDLKALEYFEKMAQKNNNPKLKLVGYVVTLVDMGVGYYVYSKVSTKVENGQKQEETPYFQGDNVLLVPVLAEQ